MTNWLKENIESYWLAAVMVLLALGLGLASFSWVKKTQTDFEAENLKLVALTSQRVGLAQANLNHAQIILDKKKLESAFVNKDKLVDFIVFLENLAKDTGNSANVRSVDDTNDKDHVVFKVELSGPYSGLINFLASLEKSGYLVYASQISITKFVDAESKSALLKTDLTIKFLSL